MRGRDLRSVVHDMQAAVAAEVALPPGYALAWSGQFEYLERANARLMVVVPATLLMSTVFYVSIWFSFAGCFGPDDDAIPQGLGAALRARQRVEFDWKGEGELIKNGTSVGTFEGHATIAADPQCSIYRLVLDGGFSGPVYVNCPWAETELPL